MEPLTSELQIVETTMLLSKAAGRLDAVSRPDGDIEESMRSIGLDHLAAGKAAEGRATVLFAALSNKKPVTEIGFVKIASHTHLILMSAAWTEGLLLGLLMQAGSLPQQAGFLQIAEASRKLDSLSEEHGPAETSLTFGLQIEYLFRFCKARSEILLQAARMEAAELKINEAQSQDPWLDKAAAGALMDGLLVGCCLRSIDHKVGEGPSGDIPASEL